MIKEKISYVIPIALDNSSSGTPVLIYEVQPNTNEVDLSFGIFFIGLRAGKKYSVGIEVFNNNETPIPINTPSGDNHLFFIVKESEDGENTVSASIRKNFKNVKINKPGIFEVRASLVSPEEEEKLIDRKSSFFDIKPLGIARDEFR